jgi:Molybdopterin oxidoreductase Fe4S4 domain
VHLRDSEIRCIDGNLDRPINQGVICSKGASGITNQELDTLVDLDQAVTEAVVT